MIMVSDRSFVVCSSSRRKVTSDFRCSINSALSLSFGNATAMKKQFLGTSDGQMVISNFRQPQIGACNKADFTIVNRIKMGRICLECRYS